MPGSMKPRCVDNYVQDQTTAIVDLYFYDVLETTNLTVSSNIDDTVVKVPSGTGFVANDYIYIKELTRNYQAMVLSVAVVGPNKELTLDTPIDFAFTTSAIAERCTIDMNVDGSGTAKEFCLTAPAGVKWDITRTIIHIEDNSAMDDGTFGGGSALTNGIVLRKKNGDYFNVFNIKKNENLD